MLQSPEALEAATEHVLAVAQNFKGSSATGNSHNAPNAQQLLSRRLQAWDLRVAHKSFREIAQRLGVSPTTAFQDVLRAGDLASERRKALAAKCLDIEVERSEYVCGRMMKRMEEKDDPRAAQAYIHASEHRCRLLGIYAPEKVLHAGMVITGEQLAGSRDSLAEKLEGLRQRMLGEGTESRQTIDVDAEKAG